MKPEHRYRLMMDCFVLLLFAIAVVLLFVFVGSARAETTKAQAHRSVAVSQVLGMTATCVPDRHWRGYLRSIGIAEDTPWVLTSYFGNDWETSFASVPDGSCRGVTRAWAFPDWAVAIPLYYFAELVAPNDREQTIDRTFYSLRRAFGIRRSVTISDYFPEPDPAPSR